MGAHCSEHHAERQPSGPAPDRRVSGGRPQDAGAPSRTALAQPVVRRVASRTVWPPREVRADALLGPTSASARLLTHPGILLAGPRALLLQVATPGVAAGVADHSDYRVDPFARLVGTLATVATIAFGSTHERRAALANLDRAHGPVRGRTPTGMPYSARQPHLVTWVHATLVDSALAVDQRWLHLLDEPARKAFYVEQQRLGDAFGVPPRSLPDSLPGFEIWMARAVRALEVTPQARTIAREVLRPPLRTVWGRAGAVGEHLAAPALEAITADLLPEPLPAAFGLRRPGPVTRVGLASLGALIGSARLLEAARARGRSTQNPEGTGRVPAPDAPSRLAARLGRQGVGEP